MMSREQKLRTILKLIIILIIFCSCMKQLSLKRKFGGLTSRSMSIVREAEVQKYMFTYHIAGQFNFMFILYLQV